MDSEFGQPVHDIGIYLMQQDKLDESIHNPGLPFSSSALTCHTPKAADRLGLALNVGDKGRVGVKWTLLLTPQPHSASLLLRRAILESH